MPVDVKYEPYKELIIKDVVYEPSVDKLAALVAPAIAAGGQVYLQWAEGIVWIQSAGSPDVQYEDLIKGKVIWLGVTCARMPKFEAFFRTGGIEVPVIDVSTSELNVAAAKWLKSQLPKAQ